MLLFFIFLCNSICNPEIWGFFWWWWWGVCSVYSQEPETRIDIAPKLLVYHSQPEKEAFKLFNEGFSHSQLSVAEEKEKRCREY